VTGGARVGVPSVFPSDLRPALPVNDKCVVGGVSRSAAVEFEASATGSATPTQTAAITRPFSDGRSLM